MKKNQKTKRERKSDEIIEAFPSLSDADVMLGDGSI